MYESIGDIEKRYKIDRTMNAIQCKVLLEAYKELHNIELISNDEYAEKLKEIIDRIK